MTFLAANFASTILFLELYLEICENTKVNNTGLLFSIDNAMVYTNASSKCAVN